MLTIALGPVSAKRQRTEINQECPSCSQTETALHVIRDCPWAKEFGVSFPGQRATSFFHKPLVLYGYKWNVRKNESMVFHYTPWNIIFAFGVWLSRNERIFKTIRSVLACMNIFILHTQLIKESQIKTTKIINWNWKPPFVTLNIDKSTLGNSGLF